MALNRKAMALNESIVKKDVLDREFFRALAEFDLKAIKDTDVSIEVPRRKTLITVIKAVCKKYAEAKIPENEIDNRVTSVVEMLSNFDADLLSKNLTANIAHLSSWIERDKSKLASHAGEKGEKDYEKCYHAFLINFQGAVERRIQVRGALDKIDGEIRKYKEHLDEASFISFLFGPPAAKKEKVTTLMSCIDSKNEDTPEQQIIKFYDEFAKETTINALSERRNACVPNGSSSLSHGEQFIEAINNIREGFVGALDKAIGGKLIGEVRQAAELRTANAPKPAAAAAP